MFWPGLLALAPRIVISVASMPILPPEPLPLGGYTERRGAIMEPGGDELLANVIILQSGGTRIAIVACDLLTIPESLAAEVRRTLPAGTQLFLHATHTHCAPDSQMLNRRMTLSVPGIASFKSKWLDWYGQRIRAAIASAKPVDWQGWSFGQKRVAANRGRRKGAQPDTLASWIDLRRNSGSRRLITNYAAHATTYGPEENQTRRDWPGAVEGVVLNGAIGDVSPAAPGDSPAERCSALGRLLMDESGGLRESIPTGAELKWVESPIRLDPPSPHPTFAAVNRVTPELARLAVNQFAPREAQVRAFRIGPIAMVGVPGEPTAELGRRIRSFGRGLGFRETLVVSHVDGWIGYILTPEDYDRGGYEATLSFHGRLTGNRLVEAAREALKKLAN